MLVRELESDETRTALDLAWDVFQEFEAPGYSAAGVQEFRQYLGDREQIDELELFGAFDDQKLVGMLAMRGIHISLFFVSKEYHRQGIGRQLFQYMKGQTGFTIMTVNSSPYAVPVYCRLGFSTVEKEQVTNGIRYIPMRYEQ